MAFGKRRQDTPRATAGASSTPEILTPGQRLEAIRDDTKRLFDTACHIADAVRNETAVAVPVILDDQPDPEAGPLLLKGFHRHFARIELGRPMHMVFAYRSPSAPARTDPNAQYHLHQLTGRAMEFNLFCQRAELDQALGVALQSPSVPDMVDAILVPAAFFTAVFENMLAMQHAPETQASAADLAAHKANIDRYLLMASDRMLDPQRLQGLVPVAPWPFVGAELDVAPHDGDYFLNGIYFSAEHASMLLGAGATQSSAAA